MAVETLAAFRAAEKGRNVQPTILVTKGTDGELYIAESEPATGGLIVTATISTAGLATDVGQAETNTKLDTIITNVDGLETAVASTNTKLDTIGGYVDQIEGYVDGIEGQLTTIEGYVDGLETAVAATNTKLDTIAGHIDGIEGELATLNAKDFATETTLQKTRKWPYATHNTIVPTEDVNNEYYTYKNSGGTTVGTITIAKATGIITYSPDKVV